MLNFCNTIGCEGALGAMIIGLNLQCASCRISKIEIFDEFEEWHMIQVP